VTDLWGLADYQVNEIIEVFAERDQAEQMLREALCHEPAWVIDRRGYAARDGPALSARVPSPGLPSRSNRRGALAPTMPAAASIGPIPR